MKLPSRLFRSRHGVFYFRIQYYVESKRVDRRFSLQTKSPTVAKAKALQISAIMARSKVAGADMSRFNPDDPSTWDGVLGEKDSHRKLDIELPNGMALRNINTREDVENAKEMLEFMNIATLEDRSRFVGGSNPQNVPQTTSPEPESIQGGMTLDEAIEHFATRNRTTLAKQTQDEYTSCQKNFASWYATKKRKNHLPIRLVTREDISAYIDDLLAEPNPIGAGTIKQKYMAALNGLFKLAQSSGAYPRGEIPSMGHTIISKNTLERQQKKTGWRPFTDEELIKIFSPDTFLSLSDPSDFWLPLLGLFTGARIEELCQMLIDEDVRQVGEGQEKIWVISITDLGDDDEEDKQIKTDAARRLIPLHPKLIELGFLDYVEDAKPFGRRLFPYLTANRYGKYQKRPSKHFGEYLDKLGITHRGKVFHSFRKTSNNKLKQSRVTEEERCQFVGHKHETTNSYVYGEDFDIPYLLENVANKLIFNRIDFSLLTYKPGQFTEKLAKECRLTEIRKNHRKAKQEREQMIKKPGA